MRTDNGEYSSEGKRAMLSVTLKMSHMSFKTREIPTSIRTQRQENMFFTF